MLTMLIMLTILIMLTLLTMLISQVSGTEFFTAVFEWHDEEELVPAVRGVCLRWREHLDNYHQFFSFLPTWRKSWWSWWSVAMIAMDQDVITTIIFPGRRYPASVKGEVWTWKPLWFFSNRTRCCQKKEDFPCFDFSFSENLCLNVPSEDNWCLSIVRPPSRCWPRKRLGLEGGPSK